jgi:eukaryotic-like serine/threonine-protein kinase
VAEVEQELTAQIRLTRALHQGVRSSLWLARHKRRGDVVVKLLNPEHIGDDEAFERFKRMATATDRVVHPNIARIYERDVTPDGVPFLVMERLAGQTLAGRLMRKEPLSVALVTRIITQTAAGIDAAHAAGVAHRDIEPSNLFVAGTGDDVTVKILDFGVAKNTDALLAERKLTRPGQLIGAPPYLSPERIKARPDAGSGDVWALAVVAYQALTRHVPFQGRSMGETFVSIINGDYLAPTIRRADLPSAVDDVFASAFAASPTERFEKASAFARALEQALGPAIAKPVAAPPPAVRPAPRTPRAFLAFTHAVALVFGFAVALAWSSCNRAPGEATAASTAP